MKYETPVLATVSAAENLVLGGFFEDGDNVVNPPTHASELLGLDE